MLEEGRRRHLLFDRKADYRPVAADNDLVDRRSVDTGADFVLLEEGDPLLVFEVGKKDIGEYSLKVLAHLDADLFADRIDQEQHTLQIRASADNLLPGDYPEKA